MIYIKEICHSKEEAQALVEALRENFGTNSDISRSDAADVWFVYPQVLSDSSEFTNAVQRFCEGYLYRYREGTA